MYNILIPTRLYDVHAMAVSFVLKELEPRVNAIRWFGTDFPSIQEQTFCLTSNSGSFEVEQDNCQFNSNDIDLIWYRRVGNPVIDLSDEHPDFEQLTRENIHFSKSFWELLPPSTHWVNHFISAQRADCKFSQLIKAKAKGLKVPDTISSNSPEKIRDFIKARGEKVIYKSFSGMYDWKEEGGFYRQHAAPVNLSILPDDKMLSVSSGIYQTYIEKEYELRILYIDGRFIACKIGTSEHHSGQHDWRALPSSKFKITPYQLPEEIEFSLTELMESLDLKTGSIDMIRSKNGEYVFLEVNESGQFIWMELENPEVRVLGPFINYLVTTASKGTLSIDESKVSANEIFNNPVFEKLLDSDKKQHVEVGL
ncbi:hypothetical protein BIZ38_18460 [Pseudoalteromonas sp. BZK2]|uniref:hypothetical protein n=1 Tax=Pseudoalteromonas sp. BZK2 TaxID=1904458 RepID=UPI00165484A4|nr:hypothetical protein [Pseudoalteromonas sp. BZK2]MBC7010431.1 hypothetical protein [Pseudoalteromonas sp. BZK2]